MSASDDHGPPSNGRRAAEAYRGVMQAGLYDSQDAFVSPVLKLAIQQVSAATSIIAHPDHEDTWHVAAVHIEPGGCNVRPGAALRVALREDSTTLLSIDGVRQIGASASVTVRDAEGAARGLLALIAPSFGERAASIRESLGHLGQVLAAQLELQHKIAELGESGERYRTIVDATAEGILLRLSDGRIGAVNRTAEVLLGVAADQLIGRISLPVRHVLVGEDGVTAEDNTPPGLQTLRTGQHVSNVLIAIERPDGTSIWVSTNARPLIAPGESTPYAAVVSFVDVSERLKAVQALRESEERFRSLSAASPVGIFHTDRGGRVLYVNPRCASILERSAGMMVGRQLIPTALAPAGTDIGSAWQAMLATGGSFERELRIQRPSGDHRWINLCAAPLSGHDGKTVGFVGTVEDIHGRKRAETESHERQIRLSILNSIATEITSGMSVDEVIDRAVAQLGAHFPDRRVIYGQIDSRARLHVVRSVQPQGMPSLAGQQRDLTAAPPILQSLRSGWIAVDDVMRDERVAPIARRIVASGANAILNVLVRIGDEEFAILGLDAAEPHRWSEHEMTTLSEVAAYLAVALSHAHSEEERRRASLEARRTAERFQSLVQHSSDVISIFDEDTRRLYVSPSIERVLGYSPAELMPMTQAQITHPDDLAAIEQSFDKMRSRPGEPITTQFRALHRDGTWRWMESVATNFLDDPAVRGYVSNTRDISERRRAEEALRDSEARFRSAFEHALAGMALTDRDGRFTWVNESLCRMLGYDNDELLSASFHAILHPDDLDAASEDSARLFSGEQLSYQRERRFLHKRGDVVWGLLSASVLFDSEMQPIQVIGQVQDITERKHMEVALRQSDERYRALVSNSSDIITVLDAHGIVRSMSEAVERVLGYMPEELIGKTNEELCHPDDRRRMRWALARSIRSPGVKQQVELRFCHKDGSWRWLEIVTTALLGDPAIGGIVTDARDVTERKQAAAALQEANTQLEQLNQAKSDFVSLVSHEFRTPLTGILGFSELIRDEDLAIAEVKEFANDINADAQRLGRMIDQLLDLDRMQSGRIQLQRGQLQINDLILQVVQQFRTSSSLHELRLKIDEAAPPVSGDRDKLIQVLTNLVGNAIKYSPEGGEVTISSRGRSRSVHLTVRDQGVGIPDADLERIFDRYARVESGAGRFIKGIGLGLPIARQIVELHGGRIWAESSLGAGSMFHVVLPVKGSLED